MLVNLLKLIDANMKLTSILILCMVSILILMPIMTEVKINFHNLILDQWSQTEADLITQDKMNNVDQDIYIPPNYGAPDSQHGSGTR
jgi:hypothetical protein